MSTPRLRTRCARLARAATWGRRAGSRAKGASSAREAEAAARAAIARDRRRRVDARRAVASRCSTAPPRNGASARRRRCRRSSSSSSRTSPSGAAAGIAKEYELQARRARRRAHTASLDQSLELVQLWFRDLVAVASRSDAQVFNTDRLGRAVARTPRGRDLDALIACVDLCEDNSAPARAQRARGPRARVALQPAAPDRRRLVAPRLSRSARTASCVRRSASRAFIRLNAK